MSQRGSSSSNKVDYLGLCQDIVWRMHLVINRGKVLNERRCRNLAFILEVKLSCIRTTLDACPMNIQSIIGYILFSCEALHRYYEKAELLVKQCAEEDWCAAAIFQDGNDVSFENIQHHVHFLGRNLLKIIHQNSTFNTLGFFSLMEKVDGEVGADKKELLMRLEDIGNGPAIDQRVLKEQCLARYLLKKHKFHSEHMYLNTFSLDVLKPILWEKENEPAGTWGNSKFLGAGSGASGVCMTSWLGVPCAKKEFHGEVSFKTFVKEALIMAQLKHPCIVEFICCGNGEEKGDRFIAMELMEKSLFDLIEERKGVHFPLFVLLDIILQIADGVRYLHDNGVAHRDLKPQNVVVKTLRSLHHKDTYYCVKLVDFGISKNEVELSKSNTMSYRGIGTTRYMAPEVHPSAHSEGLGKVDWFKADAYSFAMTCAHVLTLKQPFENIEALSKLHMKLLDGRRPDLVGYRCPERLGNLLEECWSIGRSHRPSFCTIYERVEDILCEYYGTFSYI